VRGPGAAEKKGNQFVADSRPDHQRVKDLLQHVSAMQLPDIDEEALRHCPMGSHARSSTTLPENSL